MERPSTVTGWLSLLNRRITRLEQSKTVTVGPWVLEARRSDGALVARHITTGTVAVISPP